MSNPVETRATRDTARPICDYEGSDYRTAFWEGRGRDYEDRVERHALAQLLPPRGRRLLDVGAGFGRLARAYDGYDQVVLFDYSRSQLEYARSQLGDGRFIYVAGDIYSLPLATAAFDTTVMVRVLHHLADVPLALSQLRRVTAAGGAFVLEFANKRHLKNILRYALGRGTNPFDRQPYEFAALHFDFHPRWVAEQLVRAGFRVEQRRSVSLFRSQSLKRILPTPWLVIMDAWLQRATAPLALGPSLFVRARALGGEAVERPLDGGLFRCPRCAHEPLARGAERLTCQVCHAEWAIEKGIHILK